jgi:hypothetical protein
LATSIVINARLGVKKRKSLLTHNLSAFVAAASEIHQLRVRSTEYIIVLVRGTNQKQNVQKPPLKLEKKVKPKKCQSAPPVNFLKKLNYKKLQN